MVEVVGPTVGRGPLSIVVVVCGNGLVVSGFDVVLVDGTFWTHDEMQRLGLSTKAALDMGHLPQSGPGGMIEQLDRLPPGVRKVLIHINNTNPMLVEDSPERAELTAHGIEVAFDGMEISF